MTTRMQMYALHFWFIEEMNALLVASAATSSTGIMGFFIFIIAEKLRTAEHSALFSTFFFLLKAFLHLCSPAFLAMRLLFEMIEKSEHADAWQWVIAGQSIAWLGIQAGMYLAILLVVSSGILCDVIYLVDRAISHKIPNLAQRLIDAPAARDPPGMRQRLSHAGDGQTSTSDGAFAAEQDHLPAAGIGSSVDLGESGYLSTHLSAGSGGGAAESGGPEGAAPASIGGRRVSNGSSDRSGGTDPPRSGSTAGGVPSAPSVPSWHGSPETALPPSISERTFQGWASFGGFGTQTPPGQTWVHPEEPAGSRAASGGAGDAADCAGSGGILEAGVKGHAALVAAADPAGYMVLLRNVSKVFGGGCRSDATVAVKNVSLAIPAGHCFGLLGAPLATARKSHSTHLALVLLTPAPPAGLCRAMRQRRCVRGVLMLALACRDERRREDDDVPDAHERHAADARRRLPRGLAPQLLAAVVARAPRHRLLPPGRRPHRRADGARDPRVLRARARPAVGSGARRRRARAVRAEPRGAGRRAGAGALRWQQAATQRGCRAHRSPPGAPPPPVHAAPAHLLHGGLCRYRVGAVAQVLLLDEPSTGMDPTARRRLWAALQSARHAGHTIVLTSHAMADADVLCTRVGILVNVRSPALPAPSLMAAFPCTER